MSWEEERVELDTAWSSSTSWRSLNLTSCGDEEAASGDAGMAPSSFPRETEGHLDIDAAFPFAAGTAIFFLAGGSGGGVRSVLQPQHFTLPTLRLDVRTPQTVEFAAFPVPVLPAVAVGGSVGGFFHQPVVAEKLLRWWWWGGGEGR